MAGRVASIDSTDQSVEISIQEDEGVVEPIIGDIRQDWDLVRPGVERILQGDKRLSFRPEDVYAAVVSEQAVYWKAPEGFVISTTEVDEFTGRKTFFIWLAYAHKRGHRNLLKYTPFFKDVAKRLGMEALEVRTNHDALEDVLLDGGWDIETVVIRTEV